MSKNIHCFPKRIYPFFLALCAMALGNETNAPTVTAQDIAYLRKTGWLTHNSNSTRIVISDALKEFANTYQDCLKHLEKIPGKVYDLIVYRFIEGPSIMNLAGRGFFGSHYKERVGKNLTQTVYFMMEKGWLEIMPYAMHTNGRTTDIGFCTEMSKIAQMYECISRSIQSLNPPAFKRLTLPDIDTLVLFVRAYEKITDREVITNGLELPAWQSERLKRLGCVEENPDGRITMRPKGREIVRLLKAYKGKARDALFVRPLFFAALSCFIVQDTKTTVMTFGDLLKLSGVNSSSLRERHHFRFAWMQVCNKYGLQFSKETEITVNNPVNNNSAEYNLLKDVYGAFTS
jgi:hypothetical protein